MFKIAGLAGLVISCGFIGVIKSWDLKERVNLLENFYKVILEMNSKINYFRKPLPEVLAECSQNDDIRVFNLLNVSLVDIEQKKGDIGLIWADNITEIYGDSPLTERDLDVMSYAGSFIGQTDCENQEKQFEYMKNQLEQQNDEAKQMNRTKGPMYQRIGFFCGAIAALVLL